MPIGANIKKARKQKQLTQLQLSEMSGISQGGISLVESGQKKSPSLDVVKKIADALGVTIDDLIKGEK